MRVISVAEARAIDRDAVERLGMPSILLMENAARSVARIARRYGDRFVVLCGPGNNGGDGLAIVRHLGESAEPFVFAEPDPQRVPDAALQLEILRRAGWSVAAGRAPRPADFGSGTVWIDALFGTGLNRPIKGSATSWIDAFNASSGPKIAVDIPSGLSGDGAFSAAGVSICRADRTVTFVAPKSGMVVSGAAAFVGEIEVVGLGLPAERGRP